MSPYCAKDARGLPNCKTGDGRPLPEHLKAQIERELDRLELTLEQIKAVETERDAMLSPPKDMPAPGAMLKSLKGIGPEFAGVIWTEGLFRSFSNRRQVASYAGLAPTPWLSGSVAHEQGVSKAGNPRLRTTIIQLAWLWIRHQPRSTLTLWFHQRVQLNGGRVRKVLIVALARKLLIAFWKYVTAGVPRWTFHFTPTSASWLNAVEGFFAKLTRQRLKRGVFQSVVELQLAINRFVAETNADPKPFVWTADPKRVLAAVKRGGINPLAQCYN